MENQTHYKSLTLEKVVSRWKQTNVNNTLWGMTKTKKRRTTTWLTVDFSEILKEVLYAIFVSSIFLILAFRLILNFQKILLFTKVFIKLEKLRNIQIENLLCQSNKAVQEAFLKYLWYIFWDMKVNKRFKK